MHPSELEAYAKARSLAHSLDNENRYAFMLGMYQEAYGNLWRECGRLRREVEEARPKVMIVGEPI